MSGRGLGRVNLKGTGFTGTAQVVFGGVAAAHFTVIDDTRIHAGVPAHAVTGPLRVITPRGDTQSSEPFTIIPGTPLPSRISSILPTSGPVGSLVTLSGTGFFSAISVHFGSVPGVLPPLTSDNQLEVRVPPGAACGPIVLTDLAGAQAFFRSFQVVAKAPPAPVFEAFNPKSGKAGCSLRLSGDHFGTVKEVRIGGTRINAFHLWGEKEISVWLPFLDPPSGIVSLTSPSGTVSHPIPFVLMLEAPSIRSFAPSKGPVGGVISLFGNHLENARSVSFGGVVTTGLQRATASEIRVAVPPGARRGPLAVRTPAGEATSSMIFEVTKVANLPQVQIEGAYLTQATQRMDGSVPLVANRDGLLRVFLTADRRSPIHPRVRVTLQDAQGGERLREELLGSGGGVSTELKEGNLSASWNLPLPGRLIQPGLRLLVEVLPTPGLEVPASGAAFPANGIPMRLDVREVPPIGITLIPVISGGKQGNVSSGGRTLESWVAYFKALYPLGEVDVRQGRPFHSARVLGTDHWDYTRLRNELEMLRLLEDSGSRRYHYGVFKTVPGGTLMGKGDFPPSAASNLNRTAVGYDWEGREDRGEDYQEVFAHEMGHLLDRRHSPCGSAAGPDPDYPYPGAELGAFGLKVSENKSIDPNTYVDVMSYCSPQWISDYTYKGVLAFRAQEPQAPAAGAVAFQAHRHGLLIWGTLRNGVVALEPAFAAMGVSSLPEPGEYTLVCLDGAGQVLQGVPFNPQPDPDPVEGEDLRSFAFVIPETPAMRAALASIQVRRGGETLATLRASRSGPAQGALAVASLSRDPVAVRWRSGRVHLGWDATRYPRVIVRDPLTGQDLAIAEGGSMELGTQARELELIFSDGLRTFTKRIGVQE